MSDVGGKNVGENDGTVYGVYQAGVGETCDFGTGT
jgi:hypothetical protein